MALPGVGKRLADKIWEIAESGELRKLQELRSNDDVRILEIFTNVWGAGPTTAQQWLQQVSISKFFNESESINNIYEFHFSLSTRSIDTLRFFFFTSSFFPPC